MWDYQNGWCKMAMSRKKNCVANDNSTHKKKKVGTIKANADKIRCTSMTPFLPFSKSFENFEKEKKHMWSTSKYAGGEKIKMLISGNLEMSVCVNACKYAHATFFKF